MPEKRFYLDSELLLHSLQVIAGEEFQHLKVMRCHEGDVVEIINGKGTLAHAKILSIDKREGTLEILSMMHEAKTNEIVLAQGLPRLNRLDTILEKCTELGVSKILLFPAMHSEKKDLSPTQLQRIQHILIAASKQCGRLHLPEFAFKLPLAKWSQPEGNLYYGDVSSDAPLLKNVLEPKTPIIFFVGPESGFSQQEENQLREWGAKGVKLHDNILRTDTAPIVALSLISHLVLCQVSFGR